MQPNLLAAIMHGAAHAGVLDQIKNRLAPTESPSQGELNEAYARKLITPSSHQRWSKWNGWDFPDDYYNQTEWTQAVKGLPLSTSAFIDNKFMSAQAATIVAAKWHPELEIIFELKRRDLIDNSLFNFWMQQLGMDEDSVIETVSQLQYIIPEVDELIRFGTRHAFDPDIIKKYEFANEIPPTIEQWVRKKGLGMHVGFDKPQSVRVDGGIDPARPATWFDLYWFAHWVYPSLSDGYTMLQRLYPASPRGPSPESKGGNTWTVDDMSTLLRSQDIPTYFRKRLMAISYIPLTRVDVRRMFKLKVLNEDEVYHAYRAQGYSDENAERLLRFTKAQAGEEDNVKASGLKKEAICKWYTLGIIERSQAEQYLATLQLSDKAIELFLDNCDQEVKYEHVKKEMGYLKESFFQGAFKKEGIAGALQQLGIVDSRVQQYADDWDFERTVKRKQPAAAQFKEWLAAGLMLPDEVTARMQNLNFESIYITNLIKGVAKSTDDKNKKEQAKLLKQLLDAQTKQQKQSQKPAKSQKPSTAAGPESGTKGETEANIKLWLQKKLVSEAQAKAMLEDIGIAEPIAELIVKGITKSSTKTATATKTKAGNVTTTKTTTK